MTTETALLSGLGALASAVIFLFGLEQTRHKATAKRLDECEAERLKLVSRVAKLEAGCGLSECPLRQTSTSI